MPTKKKRVTKKKSSGKVRRLPSRIASSRTGSQTKSTTMSQKKNRMGLVVKNLITFAILFVLFLVLYYVTNDAVYENLFWILAVLTGFVGVAFLIVLLVLVFMRVFKRY